ncbi:FecR family protein [Chitinophaga polysaccharea]|uniref:FecR family protein n=1 Tax=Chitinophaga polysaccharea TaxID=1293035 RepID=A0A561PTB1_9BACT|nr:FecR family protein [Chitinophaga polysaccharea]TWF41369.1 FecR family protein [Chitinophaga polysaccharea]
MEDYRTRLAHLHHLWSIQSLSVAEQEEYVALLEQYGEAEVLGNMLDDSWATARDGGTFTGSDKVALAHRIISAAPPERLADTRVHLLRRWLAVAAVLLLLALVGWQYYVYTHRAAPILAVTDIAPGNNGAILTLGDGSQVVLDSLSDGIVAKQQGINAVISKGQLAYEATMAGQRDGEAVYNKMSTPRGKQFQLILPDGTKVWLNAATAIRYPTAFAGNERSVEVSGEAYFEVAPDKSKPFRVHFISAEGRRQGTVQALGTSFNVCAYQDDPAARITLLDGKVLVTPSQGDSKGAILVPGQQAALMNSQLANMKVQTADTSRVMAWKNGMLNLHNMALAEVMKQISRWYNIDVVYEGNIPDITFWGEISRSEHLSTVLGFMEESGIKFSIGDGGKQIIVKKSN